MVSPHRLFRRGVAPGEQGPGLTFAVAVVTVAAGTHLGTRPAYASVIGEYPTLSLGLVLLLYVLLVTPLVLHVAAAIETVALIGVVPSGDRGGVSETVQVIAYASAPCVFVGVPVAPLRVVCTLYGFGLLVVGTRIVHRTTWVRALVASVLPGALVFGYGFGGFDAVSATVAVLA